MPAPPDDFFSASFARRADWNAAKAADLTIVIDHVLRTIRIVQPSIVACVMTSVVPRCKDAEDCHRACGTIGMALHQDRNRISVERDAR